MVDMELGRLLRMVWKWLWLIVVAVGIAAAASYYASQSMEPMYRTSLTLMVGGDIANPNLRVDELTTSQRLAEGYAAMAQRQPVLEATIKALGLETSWTELRDRVVANRIDGTQLIEIRVVDNDPSRVKIIAEEIARQLIVQSPTTDFLRELEVRREFVRQQLDSVQADIQQAETALAEKKAALPNEVSARGVLDLRDEIAALELKLEGWRAYYAELMKAYQASATNTLSVVEPAYEPFDPISPNVRANVLLAGAVGLLLVLGVVFLIEYLNGTASKPEEIARALALPTLGSIVNMGKAASPSEGLITSQDPLSPAAEAYRVSRTSIQSACVDEGSLVLLVTSPGLCEGKSTTSANLAVSFAETGRSTVLVDADLRRPSIHTLFGLANGAGLTSLFTDRSSAHSSGRSRGKGDGERPGGRGGEESLNRLLDSCLLSTGIANLRILPSGPLPASPSELLSSARMKRILGLLGSKAEVIVVDSPPVLPVADAGILAAQVTGVVLVVEANATRIRAAMAAKEALMRTHCRIIGVVLNKVPRRAFSSYYHYYRSRRTAPDYRRLIAGTIPGASSKLAGIRVKLRRFLGGGSTDPEEAGASQ